MIIDGDSFANIASDTLMKKLNLSCIKHPRPYRLQWFNKCGEVKITKQVYDDQMKLKKECEDEKSENSREDNCERRSSDLAKSKSLVKLVESGGKTRGVKKVSLCDDNSVEKLKKQPNFYAKGAKIRSVVCPKTLQLLHFDGIHSYSAEIVMNNPFRQRRSYSLTNVFEASISTQTLA